MDIRFHFDLSKAIQVMGYFIVRLDRVEKVKLMKLVYIADKENFLTQGYPITGDRQCAMPWGPVPSDCLHAVNGEIWPNPDEAFKFIHVDDSEVSLRKDPGTASLSPVELESLERVYRVHGNKSRWTLVGETHRYPEYKEAYVVGTSRTIPYESILRHSGAASTFS